MVTTLSGIIIEVNATQFLKMLSLKDVTPSGIVKVTKEVHPVNAPAPRRVIPSGRLTDVRDVHPAKVFESISVTCGGIVTVVNDVQESNAFAPMARTVSGKETVIKEAHPANKLLLNMETPGSNVNDVITAQSNGKKLTGATTFVREVHFANALGRIMDVLLGITIEVSA